MTALADLVEDVQSGFACGDSVDDGVVQLRMNNVDTEGVIDLATMRRVPKNATKDISRFALVEGDVMFNNTNSPELVGKSAVFRGFSEPVVFSNHFTRIRVRRDRLEPRYLARWLAAEWKTGRFSRMCNQWVNQASVRKDALLTLTVPTPPLAEQRRIADILDKADAIRRKRKEAIALTDTLLRSAFLEMFGDPVTNPKGWPVKPLGELATIRRGASPRPIDRYMGGTVPWIKIGDATASSDIYLRSTAEFVTEEGAERSVRLQPGALIIANSGVSLGFARILQIEGCIHDGWLAIEEIHPSLRPMYLVGLVNILTPYFRRMAPEGTQPNLNTSLMRGHCVAVPPCELQQRYESFLAEHAKTDGELKAASKGADDLFNALVTRAFSGGLSI